MSRKQHQALVDPNLTTYLLAYRVNGPAAVLFTYLTELHGPKYRSHVLMVVGMITSTSTLLLPMLAWGIFPRPWDFVIFGGLNSKITFHFLLLVQ